jgi:hypothetical protein
LTYTTGSIRRSGGKVVIVDLADDAIKTACDKVMDDQIGAIRRQIVVFVHFNSTNQVVIADDAAAVDSAIIN